ncbi:2-methylcitrate dehydratase [Thalassovita gelatinovora]|uniref:2-methylcitrate dehydratase n=1 Tax=Thalassovita gelatinovora TaxID=53501 RepID=A0A0P1FSR6_THAGE|nr:MmgE/PrpD family protein [Thalassovita gelatinovora]QIZ81788.1 MmgE/PrpD family protein [Thalassovita gelatinovora]CUH62320.1 2-methylcitrate dehydratase [Thalassovita gelatinovora]SER15578.1 2-methylcitrate dehydratase PrpD [Thalassovita gelatinovora]
MKDANVSTRTLTENAAGFAASLSYDDIPEHTRHIAKRCIIDGLGVMLAGTEQEALTVAERYLGATGATPVARPVGNKAMKVSPQQAAFWNGLAGHAMDWDDTQVAEGPDRPYGLLTHPTVPPLSAVLALTEAEQGVSGKDFLTGFVAGVEVESKIAEAINPDHYNLGFHTSGTIGTFGSAAAAARILQLDAAQMAQALGGAASMAAGIRANFGTMGKPMHVARSSENGVTSALLVREGFTFNDAALDGQWGYLSVAGRGGEPDLVLGRFGNPFSLSEPGVSIKPYPCGVLTHPSMDTMKALMEEHGLTPGDIEKVTLFASNNILHPIRFRTANTELEGKFCMAFLLSAIILTGRAGKAEFTDAFVQSPDCQAMQQRVETQFDPDIAAMGHDKILSRIEVVTKSGKLLQKFSDDRYRGGPANPLSDAEVEAKFMDCVSGILSDASARAVLDMIWSIEDQPEARRLLDQVNG